MQYTMKLFEKPYRDLEQGKKTIELRLCDKKRDSIREGDIIIFYLYGKAVNGFLFPFTGILLSHIWQQMGVAKLLPDCLRRHKQRIFSAFFMRVWIYLSSPCKGSRFILFHQVRFSLI